MMSRLTPALTNSSTCARCLSVSFWASLKMTFSPGCPAAAALRSAFICTRHGSPRLHWLMPMTNAALPAALGLASGAGLPQPAESRRERAREVAAKRLVFMEEP
jgi:hypothetical protein